MRTRVTAALAFAASGFALSTPGSAAADERVALAAPGMVVVHLASPNAMSLERRADPSAPWEHACVSPCDAPVPVDGEYRVVGTGARASEPFNLDSSKARVGKLDLEVEPASRAKYTAGAMIGGVGIAGAVAGVIVMAASSESAPVQGPDVQMVEKGHQDQMSVGMVMAIVGASATLLGSSWFLGNRASQVSGGVVTDASGAQTGRAAPPPRIASSAPAGPPARAFTFEIINWNF